MPLDDREIAARLRAARAYAGLSQEEIAQQLGISITTLSKAENGNRAMSRDRLAQAAAIYREHGVPGSFMDYGFREDAPAPEERLEAVEHRLQTIERRLQEQATLLESRLASQERTLGERLAAITRESAERRRAQAPPATGQDRGAAPKKRQVGGATS